MSPNNLELTKDENQLYSILSDQHWYSYGMNFLLVRLHWERKKILRVSRTLGKKTGCSFHGEGLSNV